MAGIESILNYASIDENNLSLEDLKKILDNSFDEISVVNTKGIIIYVNEAGARNYGLTAAEMIGKTIYHLVNEGYYSPIIAPMVFKEKQRVTVEQQTVLGKKLVVTTTPVLNSAGEIEFIVFNSRDITQLEELKYNLEETKQLVAKHNQEVKELRPSEACFEGYIVQSSQMKACLAMAQRIAAVDSTVLILGESGTGKNVMAKYIHNRSRRKEKSFININCAAIPEQLLESELFGYCRGAFTGAEKSGKVGLIELADKGTLFLDEIGEVPLRLQAKLLEVIQDNKFIPVGGREHKKVDIRIIAATNRDLAQLVKDGQFREDLYYRLNVIELNLPPLRDRPDDVTPLICYFLDKIDAKYKVFHRFDDSCFELLTQYRWPGNVREVEHLVERLAVTVAETTIRPEHLPKYILQKQPANISNVSNLESTDLFRGVSLKETEKELVIQLYKRFRSSYRVASELNISQSKASRLIRKYYSEEESDLI
ncbi:sigma-54 interaction domain-containing protein [Sporomusa sp.]|uniref:sigma-54 interaction domain-containing protein n=1 Tax=Sporomusa sp. TaxID=2078658 RepID=UPI002D1337F2|nr:sigma 54-interacting transcriptional regulator [Sporomusa sp.]HWR45620.1 sigma 54-interacting transcriptional regulator [Sporomusa sp.]